MSEPPFACPPSVSPALAAPAFASLVRPQPVALSGKRVLVLGLGDTGLSVARWVAREGGSACVADTRAAPPRLAALRSAVPAAEMHCGEFSVRLLREIDLVCASPGLSLEEPLLREAVARGVPVLGDVELFAWGLQRHGRHAGTSRVLAVTGTNGKTTVTSLTGHLLRGAGLDAEVAGNIAPPALDALGARLDAGKLPDAWVLELSSYQLETTWSLAPEAAAMLNLSEDHLDRYSGLVAYGAAKARVFEGAGVQVLNRDDPASLAMAASGRRRITFGLGVPPEDEDFGCISVNGARWLAQGSNALVSIAELPIHGWHNAANAMAAMALARAIGVAYAPLVEAVATFRGLPHRLEKVASVRGVDYYDDSKGTNVGATIAALQGIGAPGPMSGIGASGPVEGIGASGPTDGIGASGPTDGIGASGPEGGLPRRVLLIAGGVGKGQDFAPLAQPVAQYARRVLLIGEDAGRIETAIAASGVPIERCGSLEQAVEHAARQARAGDAVLLSPACASFDMFRDYKHRGQNFAGAVKALQAKHG